MISLPDDVTSEVSPFGPHEESAFLSLILDFPDSYVPLARFITPDLFQRHEIRYVVAAISQDFAQHQTVPTRALLHDRLSRSLTVEDPYEDILGAIKRESNPREVPMLRDSVHKWVKHKTLELLYSDEAIEAHNRGEYEFLSKIVEDAQRIDHVGHKGFWFFDQIEELFAEHAIEHIRTGFRTLDRLINDGGPSPGEVLIWLAPTGVGKTLMLCNNAVRALNQGHNVMFVTFELSTLKTAMRIAGSMTQTATNSFVKGNVDELSPDQLKALKSKQVEVADKIRHSRKRGDLVIYELPPETCSIDDIFGIIDSNKKTKGWVPKVVILDYLELMISRRASANDHDYTRQKSVATEVCRLGKEEHVLVYSATQTNRSALDVRGAGGGGGRDNDEPMRPANINLDKQAESFGKAMPVDYVVSLNQTEDEFRHDPAVIRLWVAKNRNGPKFESVTTNVWYDRMRIDEIRRM